MTSVEQKQKQRLRLTFGKLGALRYVGHLDLSKTLERVFRRAELPLAYTQGFAARARIQLAAPLPLGITSEGELCDIWLDQVVPLQGLVEQLTQVSPSGLPFYVAGEISPKARALQTLVHSAQYRITVPGVEPALLAERVEETLARTEIARTRRSKPYDLRPLILQLAVDAEGQLLAQLALDERGSGRPDELLDEMQLDVADADVHRMRLFLNEG